MLGALACASCAGAEVVRQALRASEGAGPELLRAASFDGDAAAVWKGWQAGFAASPDGGRGGGPCAQMAATDRDTQYGAGQTIELGQTRATPVVATAWSRAEGVTGFRDTGYAVYLDIIYTDGDQLWGQATGFRTGTHDWERQRVLVVPQKPIRSITLHLLFRGHTGRVWFDDASLTALEALNGATFDGVPVAGPDVAAGSPEPAVWTADLGAGAGVRWASSGEMLDEAGVARGGLMLRDVAAEGDFVRPEGTLVADGASARFAGEALGLEVTYRLTPLDGALRLDGEIRDPAASDRAVTAYVALPVDARGWTWWDDAQTSRPIEQAGTYLNGTGVGAGSTGQASRYPLAAVSNPGAGRAVTVPLDQPRVCRLAYDASARELYAAFDLGLAQETKRPASATFSLVLYGFDPAWGFRSALKRVYDLFPDSFVKRTRHEGIWMPFTDIATVQGPEDFGFAFHEGDNNPAWDDEHDILSFVYVEPMSHWFVLPKEAPRTYEEAVSQLERQAAAGDGGALAVLSSGAQDDTGRWDVDIVNAPWADGGVFTVEADPDIAAPAGGRTQWQEKWREITASLDRAGQAGIAGWALPPGALPAEEDGHGGVLEATREANGPEILVRQVVQVGQTAARDLVARASSSATGVTGEADTGYSLYVDLQYADGTSLWGQVAPFATGTHGWQEAEVRIRPEKPVASAYVHLILRGHHAGTARFDDVFLGEDGGANLIVNPTLEPAVDPAGVVDGTYIDSYEGWAARRDYRREHFAAADLPLTFSTDTRQPVLLTYFSTYEFGAELAKRMWALGKLMMANSTPWNYPWGVHTLDVMGTETNWCVEGRYQPDSHAIFAYRRALCYQKPYLLLQNTVYDQFTPEMVERYMKRSVFYGVYPSFFSHNAADDPYWQRPALYNRDRPLFRKYIPLCRTLSTAGWEPVTYARTDVPGFLIERHGKSGDAVVYLSVFRSGDGTGSCTVSLDAEALGVSLPAEAQELVSSRAVTVDAGGRFSLELDAEDLAVVAIPAGG